MKSGSPEFQYKPPIACSPELRCALDFSLVPHSVHVPIDFRTSAGIQEVPPDDLQSLPSFRCPKLGRISIDASALLLRPVFSLSSPVDSRRTSPADQVMVCNRSK